MALSSGKIDKYGYLTGEEILPSKERQIIEQAQFKHSHLFKAFEKQKSVEGLFSKEMKIDEIKNEIDEIKKLENKFKQKDFESNRYIFDFQQFQTIRSFGDSIKNLI